MSVTPAPSSARLAYETLEPFHITAYFNPDLGTALESTGLDGHAFYIGGRAAPLGPCAAAVVTSTFVNFSPDLVESSWRRAVAAGLDTVVAARDHMLKTSLGAILGDRAGDRQLTEAADTFVAAAADLPLSGRPLAAAWAAATAPPSPLLRLWYAFAVLREWRGDNHIAALVVNGLGGFDAAVFHEAQLPDPTVRRRTMGRRLTQLTRGYDDAAWDAAVDRLVERGLAERTDDDKHRLTAAGAAVYDDLEATTDALGEQVWSTPSMRAAVEELRPYVKAIIDAEFLPGTKRKR